MPHAQWVDISTLVLKGKRRTFRNEPNFVQYLKEDLPQYVQMLFYVVNALRMLPKELD